MPARVSERLLPTSIRLSRRELELAQGAARAVDLPFAAFMRKAVLAAARGCRPVPVRTSDDAARTFAEASAEVEGAPLRHDNARDEWLLADVRQRAFANSDAANLKVMSRDAEKRFTEARDQLEAAVARLNDLKLASRPGPDTTPAGGASLSIDVT